MTRRTFALFSLLPLLLFGCTAQERDGTEPAASALPTSGPPVVKTMGNPTTVTVTIADGSERRSWLAEQANAFMALGPRTGSGRSIVIEPRTMGSGEAMAGIVDGTLKPHVFSPASSLYIAMLNDAWMKKTAKIKEIS